MRLLDAIYQRANLNDPNVPLTGSNLTASQTFGHLFDDDGTQVNSVTMLHNSAVWAAYDVISSSVAKLPVSLFRVNGDAKEVASSDPRHRVLHRRPNSYMTPFLLKQVLQGHALTHGNGFGWIIRSGDATPLEIVPLMPDKTSLKWVGDELWCLTEIRGEKLHIPYIDILHIRGATPDGLVGYLLSAIGNDTIKMGLQLRKFSNKFFGQGAKPSVVLEHPGTLDEEAAKRIRTSWQDMHAGVHNAGKAAVLEEGMKANFLTMSPEDAQALESMRWNVTDVARIFRIPPHKIADLERATFSNVSEAERQFLNDCLDPWLTVWEEECNCKLLTERAKTNGSAFYKFNTAKLLRMNLLDRYQAYEVGIRSGIINPNEARDTEDLNPYEGGDTYQQTLNNAPVGGEGDDAEQEGTETGVDSDSGGETGRTHTAGDGAVNSQNANTDACRQVLVEALTRMTKRLAVHATKRAKKPEQFCEWIDGGMADHTPTLVDALAPAAALFDKQAGQLADALRQRAVQQLSELVEQTTYEELATEVQRVTDTWLAFMPTDLTNTFISEAA